MQQHFLNYILFHFQVRQALSNLQSNSSHNNGLYAVGPRRQIQSPPPPPPPQTLPPPITTTTSATATVPLQSTPITHHPSSSLSSTPVGIGGTTSTSAGNLRIGTKGGRNSNSSGSIANITFGSNLVFPPTFFFVCSPKKKSLHIVCTVFQSLQNDDASHYLFHLARINSSLKHGFEYVRNSSPSSHW